jgi:acetyl esterase/lipase
MSLWIVVLALSAPALAAQPASRDITDIVYAQVGAQKLALDLHLPATATPAPLVVYLHGGGWMSGNKTQYPAFLVQRGFAVASVDFRSTNDAPFPANVHDIKAAIRFLRAEAQRYGYSAERLALSGASSGGHLAALAGVTNGNAELEGTVGDHLGTSSDVQGIVSFFGASNLTTILAQSTAHGTAVRVPALRKLFGGAPEDKQPLARMASPVYHVDRGDPPLLLLHGDQDVQMPINQMHELDGAYAAVGLQAETHVLHGVGHDATPFFEGAPAERVADFLKRTLAR